jgi:hypothetical protein
MNGWGFVDPWGLENVVIKEYLARGGPRKTKIAEGDLHAASPTRSGTYKIYKIDYKHVSRNYYPTWSSIPWGSPLRWNPKIKQLEVKLNGSWKTLEDIIPNKEARPTLSMIYFEYKKLYKKIFKENMSYIKNNSIIIPPGYRLTTTIYLPKTWIFNDFGHLVIKYYNVRTGMRSLQYFHTTPTTEALIKTDEKRPNEITPELLGESHGCTHLIPTDINEMISKKYVKIGNIIKIHSYNEDPNEWLMMNKIKRDETGGPPYEIHFFPGFYKLIIIGNKK